MKIQIKFLLAVGLFLFGLSGHPQEQSSGKDLAEMKVKTSAVCGMCKETLESKLIYEKGVKSVDLNLDDMVLTVQYKPAKTDTETLKKAINDLGYDADDTKANPKKYDRLHECCKKDSHQ